MFASWFRSRCNELYIYQIIDNSQTHMPTYCFQRHKSGFFLIFLNQTKSLFQIFQNRTNLPLCIHPQERIFQDLQRCLLGRVDKCPPVDVRNFGGGSVGVCHLFKWISRSRAGGIPAAAAARRFCPLIHDARGRTTPPDCKICSQ